MPKDALTSFFKSMMEVAFHPEMKKQITTITSYHNDKVQGHNSLNLQSQW